MTNEEAIENIKLIRFNAAITNANSFKEALDMAIKALSQPSLPSDLEEAADAHIRRVAFAAGHPGWDWTTQDIAEAFKAGAEWMAGQGVKVEGRVSSQQGKRMMVTTNIFENDDWFVSDKVECFIRKKQ